MQHASKALCALASLALVAGSQGAAVSFLNNCGCPAEFKADIWCNNKMVSLREDIAPGDEIAPVDCSPETSYGYWMMDWSDCHNVITWREFLFDAPQTIRICDYSKEPHQGSAHHIELETVSKKPSLRSQPW